MTQERKFWISYVAYDRNGGSTNGWALIVMAGLTETELVAAQSTIVRSLRVEGHRFERIVILNAFELEG